MRNVIQRANKYALSMMVGGQTDLRRQTGSIYVVEDVRYGKAHLPYLRYLTLPDLTH